ncbi:MAG: RND transporter, partial [Deltaproteobacteria bacterium]|nr:RND transporter [Deltaproteobacteria bacterium]
MKKHYLVEFSVRHPKLVVVIVALVTLGFLTQFPKIKTDTNPKNMLPPTSDVRVWNDEVDGTFGLYEDMIAVGIVSDEGVLNERTLGKVLRITDEVLRIEGVAARDVNALPTITNVTAEAGALKVAPLMSEVPKTRAGMDDLRKDLFENPLFRGRVISDDGKTTAIYIPLEKGANGKTVADSIKEVVKREGGPER